MSPEVGRSPRGVQLERGGCERPNPPGFHGNSHTRPHRCASASIPTRTETIPWSRSEMTRSAEVDSVENEKARLQISRYLLKRFPVEDIGLASSCL